MKDSFMSRDWKNAKQMATVKIKEDKGKKKRKS